MSVTIGERLWLNTFGPCRLCVGMKIGLWVLVSLPLGNKQQEALCFSVTIMIRSRGTRDPEMRAVYVTLSWSVSISMIPKIT